MKRIVFLLLLLTIFLASCGGEAVNGDVDKYFGRRSADPCNAWARPGWIEGPERVNTEELRNGNASHNLSPAEIVYYSVAENTIGVYKINPVLILTYLENADLLSQGKEYGDFESRLLKAVSYGGADVKKYNGFYPQLVASTFQWYAYQKRGVSFADVQKLYPFISTRPFAEAYAEYARIMNGIAGTTFSESPDSRGYYQDFSGMASKENIQEFFEKVNSPLKEEDLFRQWPMPSMLVNYVCTKDFCE